MVPLDHVLAMFHQRLMDGGPLAIVQDKDMIEINIPKRKLNIKISEAEIKKDFQNGRNLNLKL